MGDFFDFNKDVAFSGACAGLATGLALPQLKLCGTAARHKRRCRRAVGALPSLVYGDSGSVNVVYDNAANVTAFVVLNFVGIALNYVASCCSKQNNNGES